VAYILGLLSILFLATPLGGGEPADAGYHHPVEVHMQTQVPKAYERETMQALSGMLKRVKKHPSFDLVEPDPLSVDGTWEFRVSIVIQSTSSPGAPVEVGTAWEIWLRHLGHRRLMHRSPLYVQTTTVEGVRGAALKLLTQGVEAAMAGVLELDKRFLDHLELWTIKRFNLNDL
jgi:hypothetical protein